MVKDAQAYVYKLKCSYAKETSKISRKKIQSKFVMFNIKKQEQSQGFNLMRNQNDIFGIGISYAVFKAAPSHINSFDMFVSESADFGITAFNSVIKDNSQQNRSKLFGKTAEKFIFLKALVTLLAIKHPFSYVNMKNCDLIFCQQSYITGFQTFTHKFPHSKLSEQSAALN